MVWCRKEGQDTQDEVQKRNLRDELEDRERRHFSSRGLCYSESNKRTFNLISKFDYLVTTSSKSDFIC